MSESNQVPNGLRTWFIVHFIVDIVFGVPLFVAPVEILTMLGWQAIDPIATRLAAAALFGIGIESLLGRRAGHEAFVGMLNLKIIWSACAIIGVSWSMLASDAGAPWFAWVVLITFASFSVVWISYLVRLRDVAKAPG